MRVEVFFLLLNCACSLAEVAELVTFEFLGGFYETFGGRSV